MIRLALWVLALGIVVSNAPAARSDTTPKSTKVSVWGEAPADDPNAKDLAVADALRNAVMQAIGAYVSATTIGENYQTIEDSILVKADGFATLDEIESTVVKDGLLRVRVRATVTDRPLADRLRALGLLHEWKVAVRMESRDAEDAVVRELLNSGYRVIDESRLAELRRDEAAARAAEGDKRSLARIKQEYNADLFVTGNARANYIDSAAQGGVGFYRSRGHVDYRAYYTDTAEILIAHHASAEVLDQSKSLSVAKSLRTAGERAGSDIAERMLIAPAAMTPFVSVKITNLARLSQAAELENGIKRLRGVTSVKRHRYTGGTLELDVFVKSEYRDALPEAIESSQVGKRYGLDTVAWAKTYLQSRVTRNPSSGYRRVQRK